MPPWSIIKSIIFVVFASCLCCKLFITCFLRGALIVFQLKLNKKYFLCWPRADPPKNNCCLSLYAAIFASAKPVLLLGKSQSASTVTFNSSTQLLQRAITAILQFSTATIFCSKPEHACSKIDGDMIFFPEHPFFCGPGDPLTS